jgi:transcriptional regulator with XRE-family HTH domain
MDWKQLIADLIAAGMTQVRIAEACDVSQSTISDLARGATKSPAYDLGRKLEELLAKREQQRPSDQSGTAPISKLAAA